MTDEPIPAPIEEPMARIAIGEQLRASRLSKGIELTDAAHRLNLDARALDALEQERFGELGNSVFAKGHLRSYARMLDLDPQPLLDAFDRQVGGAPPPLKKVVRIQHGPSLQASWLPAALARGTLIAVVLLVGIWILKTAWDMSNASRGPADFNDTSELALPALPSEPHADRESIPIPIQPIQPIQVPPPSLPASAGQNDPQKEADKSVANPAPFMAPAPASNSADAVTATLRFAADSWVEVYDKNEKRLFTRVGKTGESVSVSGPGPLSFVIGNAAGVSVEYQGRPYDFKRFIKGQVARFKLGASSG